MYRIVLVLLNWCINSSSLYFNYKGYFSIILMVTCDARCVFTHIGIGSYSSNNDSGVFRNLKMGEQFFRNKVHLPEADGLEGISLSEKGPCYLV